MILIKENIKFKIFFRYYINLNKKMILLNNLIKKLKNKLDKEHLEKYMKLKILKIKIINMHLNKLIRIIQN